MGAAILASPSGSWFLEDTPAITSVASAGAGCDLLGDLGGNGGACSSLPVGERGGKTRESTPTFMSSEKSGGSDMRLLGAVLGTSSTIHDKSLKDEVVSISRLDSTCQPFESFSRSTSALKSSLGGSAGGRTAWVSIGGKRFVRTR